MACSGYGYGLTRECMWLTDDSGSMGNGPGNTCVGPTMAAIPLIDPRCSRWGAGGYRMDPAGQAPPLTNEITTLAPIRRGRSYAMSAQHGYTFDGETGYQESPGGMLLLAPTLWDMPTNEELVVEPFTDDPDWTLTNGTYRGWGGWPLRKNRPPRRILILLGDEGTGINENTKDRIIAGLIEAQITVVAIDVWAKDIPANPPGTLQAFGITAEICEATGGVMLYDAVFRLHDRVIATDPITGENFYRYDSKSPEERQKWTDEVAKTIRDLRWNDTGYPYVRASAS